LEGALVFCLTDPPLACAKIRYLFGRLAGADQVDRIETWPFSEEYCEAVAVRPAVSQSLTEASEPVESEIALIHADELPGFGSTPARRSYYGFALVVPWET